MKHTKILTVLFAPVLIAGLVGFVIYSLSARYGSAIYSHDICEAHNTKALIPFIVFLSVLLGYVPAVVCLSNLLYAAPVVVTSETEQVKEILTSDLFVGKVITSIGANCALRVKSIKCSLVIPDEYELCFSI